MGHLLDATKKMNGVHLEIESFGSIHGFCHLLSPVINDQFTLVPAIMNIYAKKTNQ